jgi:uncharacterized membrane protein
MSNTVYLKLGKLFFAVAILAIGIIHIVTRNFPTGLMPVPATVAGRAALVYISGIALVVAGLLILVKKYSYYGALLAGTIWLVLLLLLDLPLLIPHLHDPGPWTITFETAGIFSGALLLMGRTMASKLIVTARYIFLLALIVFGVQHYMYLNFITTLIPAWLPAHLFWAWLVMIVFFATALSLLIQKLAKLSALLLAIMFLLWVIILHLPRVVASPYLEPEWTSMFVALAFGSVSLLLVAKTHK